MLCQMEGREMPENDKRGGAFRAISGGVAVVFFSFGCLLLYFTIAAYRDIKTETHELTTTICLGISVMCIGFAWVGSLLAAKG
jgi:hypothetical protein